MLRKPPAFDDAASMDRPTPVGGLNPMSICAGPALPPPLGKVIVAMAPSRLTAALSGPRSAVEVGGELDGDRAVLEAADQVDVRDRHRSELDVGRDRDLDGGAAREPQPGGGVVKRGEVEVGLDVDATEQEGDEAVGVRGVDDQLALFERHLGTQGARPGEGDPSGRRELQAARGR